MPGSINGYLEVRAQIATACTATGRAPGSVTLVTVSKTQSAAAILPVLQAGQRVFGENRVQEARQKWPSLKQQFPDVELHLIGPLQSNKAAEAVAIFDVIQTVDREKLLVEIAKEMARQKRNPRLYVQVNTGLEPQKAGIAPDALADFLRRTRDTHGVRFSGLMCIPPVDEDPIIHFTMLARLARDHGLAHLSMGMSSDYQIAIAAGATHVRVGSAIFGTRPAPHPPAAR
jgi:PLP dependent protein